MRPERCAFHPNNHAHARCRCCARPLCPSCDHRVRGFPYCQDCIVAGVELLEQQRQGPRLTYAKGSPLGALLLSLLVPGLGAAYNGQPTKALVHFAAFAGLFQLSVMTDAPIFVFGGIGAWLYAAIDAYKTAKLIGAGFMPDAEADAIARHLTSHPATWGALLLCLGATLLLRSLFGVALRLDVLLPLALVLFGTYLILEQRRRKGPRRPSFETPPPSVVEDHTLRLDRDLPQTMSRRR